MTDDLDLLLAAGRRTREVVDEAAVRRDTDRWAKALAIALIATAVSGVVADSVAAAQLVADQGPWAFAWVWPLGGLGLIVSAVVQVRYVDRLARVSVLTTLLYAYGAAFVVAMLLFASGLGGGIPAAVTWLLADQMNFLLPVVVWALAGDVFTAGQGATVFPRLTRWLYAGQVAGMVGATVVPLVWPDADRGLAWLLIVAPVLCIVAALTVPRLIAGSTAATGHQREETVRLALAETRDFLRDLPAFRWLWRGSLLMTLGVLSIEFGFFQVADEGLTSAGDVQAVYAGSTAVVFAACLALQTWVTPKLLRQRGTGQVLFVLPVAVSAAAAVMVVGGAARSVAVAAVAIVLVRIPRWSVDNSARQAALATLPDEQRARSSFLIDVIPFAAALVLAAVPVSLSVGLDQPWISPALALALSIPLIVIGRKVMATWDDTQLSYRLKRRKRLN